VTPVTDRARLLHCDLGHSDENPFGGKLGTPPGRSGAVAGGLRSARYMADFPTHPCARPGHTDDGASGMDFCRYLSRRAGGGTALALPAILSHEGEGEKGYPPAQAGRRLAEDYTLSPGSARRGAHVRGATRTEVAVSRLRHSRWLPASVIACSLRPRTLVYSVAAGMRRPVPRRPPQPDQARRSATARRSPGRPPCADHVDGFTRRGPDVMDVCWPLPPRLATVTGRR